MHNELGGPARAGGRQDPLCLVGLHSSRTKGTKRQAARDGDVGGNRRRVALVVVDRRVHLRVLRDRRQQCMVPSRRTEHDPARATVEVDERLDLLREGARPYLHEPYCEPVEEEWYGWRPMTYDSLPIIGAAPALTNVIVAAGHNMLGLSMAPATGRLVAELLNDATPHVDPAPYAPTRF